MKHTVKTLALLFISLTLGCSSEDKQEDTPFSVEKDGFTLELTLVKDQEITEDIEMLQLDMYPSEEDWRNRTNKIYSSPVVIGDQELFIEGLKSDGEYYLYIYTSDGKYDNWDLGSTRFLTGFFFSEAPRGSIRIGIKNSNRRLIGNYIFERFGNPENTSINVFPPLVPVSMSINSNYSITLVDRNQNTGEIVNNTVNLGGGFTYISPLVRGDVRVTVRPDSAGGIEIDRTDNFNNRVYYVLDTTP